MRIELKKSAIFGSQWTATLNQSLVLVKWRHGLTTQLVSIVSFLTRIFFGLKFQNFDLCLWSHYLLIIFVFTKIYFVNLESYFILHSMYFTIIFLIYVLCFQHVFWHWYDFVCNRMPYIVLFSLKNSGLEFSYVNENTAVTSPLCERCKVFKRPCLLTTSTWAWKIPIRRLFTHVIESQLDVLVRDNEYMVGL